MLCIFNRKDRQFSRLLIEITVLLFFFFKCSINEVAILIILLQIFKLWVDMYLMNIQNRYNDIKLNAKKLCKYFSYYDFSMK